MEKFFYENKTCCCNCWLGPVVRWKISVSFNLPIIQFYHLFFDTFPKFLAFSKKNTCIFLFQPFKERFNDMPID